MEIGTYGLDEAVLSERKQAVYHALALYFSSIRGDLCE